ncbi:hypothetical protein CVT26_008897 [Gymnopilus dilepis]|uniref:Uncharacterized protein n=1 Tax=Gymnopilus dilepis TaxID=231916 RepID=A0A409YAT8_9AGAR|nr:hypothetical protein CVT26_008897 [Gymnopilus dilepis]
MDQSARELCRLMQREEVPQILVKVFAVKFWHKLTCSRRKCFASRARASQALYKIKFLQNRYKLKRRKYRAQSLSPLKKLEYARPFSMGGQFLPSGLDEDSLEGSTAAELELTSVDLDEDVDSSSASSCPRIGSNGRISPIPLAVRFSLWHQDSLALPSGSTARANNSAPTSNSRNRPYYAFRKRRYLPALRPQCSSSRDLGPSNSTIRGQRRGPRSEPDGWEADIEDNSPLYLGSSGETELAEGYASDGL